MSMAMYRVVAPMGVTLPIGCSVALTPEQLDARSHAVTAPEKSPARGRAGVVVTAPTSFKRGEVLGFDEDQIPKLGTGTVEPVGEVAKAAASKKKASTPVDPHPSREKKKRAAAAAEGQGE